MSFPSPRRQTRQRTVLLEVLRAVDTHPTAAELLTAVRRELPRVSLGTVYRNLEILSQDGVIRKLGFSGAESRYDGNVTPHDHVRCTGCGIVRDVTPADAAADGPDSPPLPEHLNGFRIEGRRLEYHGTCAACRDGGDYNLVT